jgi:hypothetical protein
VADNRKTLLLHYNRAIRSLVECMRGPSYSVEVGLVTCLIFICIEYLRADYPAAFTHLHNGLKIIAEQGLRVGAADKSVDTLLLSSTWERTRAPGTVTTKLIPMFNRAIVTGLLFGAPFEPLLENFCPRPEVLQPSQCFGSVMEAQVALYELRNSTVILISVLNRKVWSGNRPTSAELQHRAHLLGCHDTWLWALQRLEQEGRLSKEDSVIASSLKISYYATRLALSCAASVDETVFDAHISSVKALNYHAKIVLDSMALATPSQPSSPSTSGSSPSSAGSSQTSSPSPGSSTKPAAHFTFDISVIPPLVRTRILKGHLKTIIRRSANPTSNL